MRRIIFQMHKHLKNGARRNPFAGSERGQCVSAAPQGSPQGWGEQSHLRRSELKKSMDGLFQHPAKIGWPLLGQRERHVERLLSPDAGRV